MVCTMDKKNGLGIVADHRGVQLGTYYGAHLRTERDARAANWTAYNPQTENYLNHANSSRLHVIYLATRNERDILWKMLRVLVSKLLQRKTF